MRLHGIVSVVALSLIASACPGRDEPEGRDAQCRSAPRVLKTLPFEGSATDAEVTEDGLWVTIAPFRGQQGSLQLLDTQTAETKRTVPMGIVPIALSVSGDDVWVANASRAAVDAPPLSDTIKLSFPLENSVVVVNSRTGAVKHSFDVANPATVLATSETVWTVTQGSQPSLREISQNQETHSVSIPAGFVAATQTDATIWGYSGVGTPQATLWSADTSAASLNVDVLPRTVDGSKLLGLRSRPISVARGRLWIVNGTAVEQVRTDVSASEPVTHVDIPFTVRAIEATSRGLLVAGIGGSLVSVCHDGSRSAALDLGADIDVLATGDARAWLLTSRSMVEVRY